MIKHSDGSDNFDAPYGIDGKPSTSSTSDTQHNPIQDRQPDKDIEQLAINVIRGFAMDAPRKANSGHPGTAMALAPLAYVLWTKVMKHDPSAPTWFDRDRFILSAGHASILLYSMLYLCGYGLTLDDLKSFRQWGSKTPGHPEVGVTPGIEVTTGPLGQGFANGVGMAIAESRLRAHFGPEICDHRIFVVCSDGDLEEGISHEAASLAGHLKLGRLIYIYDDNHITIDGPTELAYTDDVAGRFRAYGWHVEDLGEQANNIAALQAGLENAIKVDERPSMLILRSHIGWPSPHLTDTSAAHGEPFSVKEIAETKKLLGLPEEEFWVSDQVLEHYSNAVSQNQSLRRAWEQRVDKLTAAGLLDNQVFRACIEAKGLNGWESNLPSFALADPPIEVATRKALGECVNATYQSIPSLMVGAADLIGNTGTQLNESLPDAISFQSKSPKGRQLHYGIREHAMGGIMNGMALHKGVLPLGGTFFIFSDYMRGAIRLAALSKAHVIYSFTHDSIGLGEDGPTHQPIEHLASLRAMPGLCTIRPADAAETAQAWAVAVERDGPVALILSRQPLPVLSQTTRKAQQVKQGAYILADFNDFEHSAGVAQIILIGTGSEVHLCLEAEKLLRKEKIAVRIVSMPSWELFLEQDIEYQHSVLPKNIPTLAVEAASSMGWERFALKSVSIDRFGASAPGKVNMEKFGFTPQNVANTARELLT